jgi:hypothetical protein
MAKIKPRIIPRKPPTSNAAADFIAGRAPSVAGKKRSKFASYERKRTGEVMRRLTVYLPEDVVRELKVWCARSDVSFSDGLAEGARALLAK